MAELKLTKTRIQAGIWEGVLTQGAGAGARPEIDVSHQGATLSEIDLHDHPSQQNAYLVRVPIPGELLGDGVQTFVISERQSGEILDSFTITTGLPIETDISAELDLLRAELDMLKRAFRRHCVETM